jgi:hypothetical protein
MYGWQLGLLVERHPGMLRLLRPWSGMFHRWQYRRRRQYGKRRRLFVHRFHGRTEWVERICGFPRRIAGIQRLIRIAGIEWIYWLQQLPCVDRLKWLVRFTGLQRFIRITRLHRLSGIQWLPEFGRFLRRTMRAGQRLRLSGNADIFLFRRSESQRGSL